MNTIIKNVQITLTADMQEVMDKISGAQAVIKYKIAHAEWQNVCKEYEALQQQIMDADARRNTAHRHMEKASKALLDHFKHA